jgi:hypothetical protein
MAVISMKFSAGGNNAATNKGLRLRHPWSVHPLVADELAINIDLPMGLNVGETLGLKR